MPAPAVAGVGTPSFKRRSANSYACPADGPISCSLRHISFDLSKSCIASYVLAISSSTATFVGSLSDASCKRASAVVVSPRSRSSIAFPQQLINQ